MDYLFKLFSVASPWELLAAVLALIYVILAVKKSMWCWSAAVSSSAIYVALMIESRLYMEAALNVFYIAMALYGYWEWRRGQDASGDMAVERFRVRDHAAAIATIAVLSAINGWLLAKHTDAARPYVDSFITWGSVVTTWMVARRVAENWLYWIVFDAIAAVLYFQQGRAPTGVLFLIYVGIAIQGFRVWLRKPDSLSPALRMSD
jgi:nicotinamide mononucleotide transporter